jgi:hypothetical protein
MKRSEAKTATVYKMKTSKIDCLSEASLPTCSYLKVTNCHTVYLVQRTMCAVVAISYALSNWLSCLFVLMLERALTHLRLSCW